MSDGEAISLVDIRKVTCATCKGEWWSYEPNGTACGLRGCTGSIQEMPLEGVAALRAELADLRNEVEILHSRIAYLESKGRR